MATEHKLSWRTLAVGIAFWGSLSTQALSADVSDLPLDQQQTARCMLSVVSAQRGVTDAKFKVLPVSRTSSPSLRTFIEYTYHHRTPGISPRNSHQEIEISEMVATRKASFVLGGLTSDAAPDLNDNDSGMLKITDGWEAKCGLTLSVVTG